MSAYSIHLCYGVFCVFLDDFCVCFSRLRFKQSKLKRFAHYMNLCYGMFYKFLGDFWEEIVFLKRFVKFREIRNIEDLMKF